jgi:hypothetical protein
MNYRGSTIGLKEKVPSSFKVSFFRKELGVNAGQDPKVEKSTFVLLKSYKFFGFLPLFFGRMFCTY